MSIETKNPLKIKGLMRTGRGSNPSLLCRDRKMAAFLPLIALNLSLKTKPIDLQGINLNLVNLMGLSSNFGEDVEVWFINFDKKQTIPLLLLKLLSLLRWRV
jgi:hypothetical protein